jgi:hypothetical protein
MGLLGLAEVTLTISSTSPIRQFIYAGPRISPIRQMRPEWVQLFGLGAFESAVDVTRIQCPTFNSPISDHDIGAGQLPVLLCRFIARYNATGRGGGRA